jgi:SAM-dependent methyltransferase
MNWGALRSFPWLDTRARFVAATPARGSLLDLGTSDGETLGHFAELRPDLAFHAADIAGAPERYPKGCQFARVNLEQDPLPWPDGSMDTVTCMHLVEHLQKLTHLVAEAGRVLKPGGCLYIETPGPVSLRTPATAGSRSVGFTLNFYDDPTHVRPVGMESLVAEVTRAGLRVTEQGVSRNWLFAASHPLLRWGAPSRKKYTAQVHWLGWSIYVAATKVFTGGK